MDDHRIRPNDFRQRLPVGTVLDGAYIIDGEIGAGGFGITYRGRDKALGRGVAIKEYFPAEIGSRDRTMSVQPATQAHGQVFLWGREGFVREAQMLASFTHPNIVRVMRFFEANNTAYMALEYEAGLPLSRWIEAAERPLPGSELKRAPSQSDLDVITRGLCDAIAAIHAMRLVHRDIAPDNIIVRAGGSPVLLDFGAARYEVAEQSRLNGQAVHTTSFAIVKAHYSPIEQRSTDTTRRGPWSDVYALGATLYRAVTGIPPPDAPERLSGDADTLVPAVEAAKGDYRSTFLEAIDRALALKPGDRLQSIAAFRELCFAEALSADATPVPVSEAGPVVPKEPSVRIASFTNHEDHRKPSPPASPHRRKALLAGAAVLLLLGLGAMATGIEWRRVPANDQVVARRQREEAAKLAAEESDRLRRNNETARAVQLEIERQHAAAASKSELPRASLASKDVSTPEPQLATRSQRRPSLWNHNGSTMRLVSDGAKRQFIYEYPIYRIEIAGAGKGTLLFDGERRGDGYTGTARTFSRACGVRTYPVTGTVSSEQRQVELKGKRPRLDSSCQQREESDDVLDFEVLELSPAPSDVRSRGSEYALDGTQPNAALNVRFDADPSSPVIGRLEPGATGIFILEDRTIKNDQGLDQHWARIAVVIDDGTYLGWVNSRYLQTAARLDRLKKNQQGITFERSFGAEYDSAGRQTLPARRFSDCEQACLDATWCKAAAFGQMSLSCSLYDAVPQSKPRRDIDVSIKKASVPAPPASSFLLQLRSGSFSLQVAANSTEAQARARIDELRARLPEVLKDTKHVVVEVRDGARQIFKARFIGLDEASARNLCDAIEKVEGRRECFVAQGS